MKILHLVYALPPTSIQYKYLSDVFFKFFGVPLYRYFSLRVLNWPRPVHAPFSISRNLIQGLSERYKVKVYDIRETVDIILNVDDMFLGHAWPDFTTKDPKSNKWESFDKHQVTNKVILRYPNDRRVVVISPFNHSLEQCGWMLDLAGKMNRYVAICGDYWISNISKSPFDGIFPCLQQLTMGIDNEQYPYVRKKFSPKLRRKFLYIGRISAEKNVAMLELIASTVEGFQGGYIGNGEIRGWKKVSNFRALSPEFMSAVLDEYDFFINLSSYDAQVTTVLEAACWGLVVCCTPESGYEEDCFVTMSATELAYNVEKIKKLQQMSGRELHDTAQRARKLITEKYSWDNFRMKTIHIIEELESNSV